MKIHKEVVSFEKPSSWSPTRVGTQCNLNIRRGSTCQMCQTCQTCLRSVITFLACVQERYEDLRSKDEVIHFVVNY